MSTGNLLVLVLIENTDTRAKTLLNLGVLCNSSWVLNEWRFSHVRLESFSNLDNVSSRLDRHFAGGHEQFAVLVSDRLVLDGRLAADVVPAVRRYRDERIVTLGIADLTAKVTEVDRIVSLESDRDTLAESLRLLIARLCHIDAPCKCRHERELTSCRQTMTEASRRLRYQRNEQPTQSGQ